MQLLVFRPLNLMVVLISLAVSGSPQLAHRASAAASPPAPFSSTSKPQDSRPTLRISVNAALTAKGSPDQEPAKIMTKKKLIAALLTDDFSYPAEDLIDPFIPFTTKMEPPKPEFQPSPEEDFSPPPPPQLPLTPLQKMSIGEVERGLKAILRGPMGKKALIEDSTGRGFIVSIGTPVTGNDGVVIDIFDAGLVIRQRIWDRTIRGYVPKEITVRLKKEKEKK